MNIQNKQCQVVVIEDDDCIRDGIYDALDTEGYSVLTFRNGKEALEGIPEHSSPCLILLDLMMPVMNGWEFMEARKHLPDTYAAIPVYIVSAVVDQQKIKSVGATGFIKKPVDLDILLRIVEKYCEAAKVSKPV